MQFRGVLDFNNGGMNRIRTFHQLQGCFTLSRTPTLPISTRKQQVLACVSPSAHAMALIKKDKNKVTPFQARVYDTIR